MCKHIVVPRASVIRGVCDENLELKALPRIWVINDPSLNIECVSLTQMELSFSIRHLDHKLSVCLVQSHE